MVEGQSFVCTGGQDEVPGQRGTHRDLCGLQIAGLADEDDVGVLAQEGSEDGGECPPDAVVDLDLVHALEVCIRRGPRR